MDPETHNPALPLLVGVLILSVVGMVPLLGGLVGFLAMVLGLGVLVQWLRDSSSATA